MKYKIISIIIVLSVLFTAFCSCAKEEQTTDTDRAPQTVDELTEEETGAQTDGNTETDEETVPETEPETETDPVTTANTDASTDEETVTVTNEPSTGDATSNTVDNPSDASIPELLPSDSAIMSLTLAERLLSMCTGGSQAANETLMKNEGFTVLFSRHYDKAAKDRSHNSAFTVGKTEDEKGVIYAITVRGTSGGEWYSNFDFAPSHLDDTQYAENFMFAAQDVYLSVKDMLDDEKNARVIVCGHSRGASTANLLGVLLDEAYGAENVYVYTYATPMTVRGEAADKEYKNIFNFINGNDIVTHLPMEEHGFKRAGNDIDLPVTPANSALLNGLRALTEIAPTISSYYNDKHALDRAGLSDDGMSVYDLMCALASLLSGDYASLPDLTAVSPESDLFPTASMLSSLSSDASLLLVGAEHMPARYLALMRKLAE